MACLKVKMFELTNTIVIIITAEDESNKMVAIVPTIKLLKVLEVNFIIQFLALSPSVNFNVSERLFTANRKRTKPAIIKSIISVMGKCSLLKTATHGKMDFLEVI